MEKTIVMLTDFGKGISTSTMDGVISMIDPSIKTFDCNHDITPFDTYEASFSLFYIIDYWAKGTIFVSVVDPTVGTDRRACVAKLSNGSYVVTPDNGSLTHMKKYVGIDEVRIIDEEKNRLQSTKACSIFHGRDLFAYCAAKLASGQITYEEVGPKYDTEDIVMHEFINPCIVDNQVEGMLETSDKHFGLICSNIPYKMVQELGINYGDILNVTISNSEEVVYSKDIPFVKSFGFVNKGDDLLMVSETLQLQLARNLENILDYYKFGTGPDWKIKINKR
ncbi:MAG: SAM hydrolase/SAM-dependent halogenase family protein [Pleomorphochaeta sp.]